MCRSLSSSFPILQSARELGVNSALVFIMIHLWTGQESDKNSHSLWILALTWLLPQRLDINPQRLVRDVILVVYTSFLAINIPKRAVEAPQSSRERTTLITLQGNLSHNFWNKGEEGVCVWGGGHFNLTTKSRKLIHNNLIWAFESTAGAQNHWNVV